MQQDDAMDPPPAPEGWQERTFAGFSALAGPILARQEGDGPDAPWAYGLRIGPQHLNLRDNVHGGLFATLADHTLGLTVWEALGRNPCATIQLNVQFVAAGRLGDFVEARAEIVRITRSVVFTRGLLRVGTRTVAMADGVWKILGAA